MLLVLALALGVSLWTIVGNVSGSYANNGLSDDRINGCQDAADVLASMDRSRNGVPLSCNSDTIARISAQ